jgi:hypothetical protein
MSIWLNLCKANQGRILNFKQCYRCEKQAWSHWLRLRRPTQKSSDTRKESIGTGKQALDQEEWALKDGKHQTTSEMLALNQEKLALNRKKIALDREKRYPE